jgi:hypothetical protein
MQIHEILIPTSDERLRYLLSGTDDFNESQKLMSFLLRHVSCSFASVNSMPFKVAFISLKSFVVWGEKQGWYQRSMCQRTSIVSESRLTVQASIKDSGSSENYSLIWLSSRHAFITSLLKVVFSFSSAVSSHCSLRISTSAQQAVIYQYVVTQFCLIFLLPMSYVEIQCHTVPSLLAAIQLVGWWDSL